MQLRPLVEKRRWDFAQELGDCYEEESGGGGGEDPEGGQRKVLFAYVAPARFGKFGRLVVRVGWPWFLGVVPS